MRGGILYAVTYGKKGIEKRRNSLSFYPGICPQVSQTADEGKEAGDPLKRWLVAVGSLISLQHVASIGV